MLCRSCERQRWSARFVKLWTSPWQLWGAHRVNDLMCRRCGAVLPAELLTERLLAKLTQLGRFGLDSEGRPLLEPAREDR